MVKLVSLDLNITFAEVQAAICNDKNNDNVTHTFTNNDTAPKATPRAATIEVTETTF